VSQVSVVICCYNSRLFLKETLDSLVRQNYLGFQLIFIDDGSTDDSCSIALNYKNKFRDLTIIQHQNKGLNESRNIGLQRAIGDYIIFLDSDDVFHPSLINELKYFLDQNPIYPAVFCDHKKFDGSDHDFIEQYGVMYDHHLFGIKKCSNRAYLNLLDILTFQHRMLEATIMIRKNTLFKINGWDVANFPKGNTVGESYSLLLSLIQIGPIGFIPEKLYNYRIHSNQITQSSNQNESKIQSIELTQLRYIFNDIQILLIRKISKNTVKIIKIKESWRTKVAKNPFAIFPIFCYFIFLCIKQFVFHLKYSDLVSKITNEDINH
jgi:glycosyltransferase involved in cell wall biosynthesis